MLLGKPHDFTLRFGEPPFVDAACRFIVIDPDAAHDRARAAREGRASRLQRRRRCQARRERPDRRRAGAKHASRLGSARCARPSPIVRRPGKRWPPREPASCIRSSCAARCSRLRRHPTPCWSATAARSGNGRRRCSRRRAASSTAPPARSAVDPVRHRRARRRAERARHRRDGRRHLRLPHGRVRHGGALQPAVRRRGRQRRRPGMPSTRSSCATTGRTARTAASCCPSRYDLVVQALGGHGELVTRAAELPAALDRAIASGKPACVNVMIERVPAPTCPPALLKRSPQPCDRLACGRHGQPAKGHLMPTQAKYIFMASMDVEPARKTSSTRLRHRAHPQSAQGAGRARRHAHAGEPFAMSIGGEEKKVAHEGRSTARCTRSRARTCHQRSGRRPSRPAAGRAEVRPHTRNRRHALYKVR